MKVALFLIFPLFISCNQMQQPKQIKQPIIIAHRGAQSIYPEHTMRGYEKSVEMGADYIEPDLVMTKDGIFVARHEPFISGTTNVGELPQFADRKTTKILDGVPITDWFVSDFTLAELKTLRARQSWSNRTQEYNDQFEIPTFAEILAFAKAHKTTSGNPVGIYPELKHPTFHKDLGLPMADQFLGQIEKAGYNSEESQIFVQCFEVATLQYIHKKSDVKLIQLIGAAGITPDGSLLFTDPDGSYHPEGQPYDFKVKGDSRTYEFFTTEEGMKFAASYADGIGPWKAFVIPITTAKEKSTEILPATFFVELAHKHNLEVHPYTFRNEDLKWTINDDSASEYQLFFEAGVDGFFSDYTDVAVKARDLFIKK